VTPAALFAGAPATPVAAAAGDTALLLYTSGTTGRPKGARITHANLEAQTALLGDVWQLSPDDRLLHALPLHHLHGLVVSLLSVLLAGGRARMLPRFDAGRVAEALGEATVWMGVPTMYHRLRERGGALPAAHLRLATSGSAALPAPLATWWQGVAGAIPLERYGMTEIGVALSNPLDPAGRRIGHVGGPLPGVEVRLDGDELLVRGPTVFAGYHERPGDPFEAGGWFRTGDVARRADDGAFRLLGRTSVDILKSGGEKLSALHVEEALRAHPAVADVAVIGLPDERWGDRVVAAVEPRGPVGTDELRAHARARLAPHEVPREIVLVDELPRNALGKVVKPELARRLSGR
jgi:malonyl-CoA/methylmalonyl-CoA synthetase